jgi:hypothetical protein
LSRVPSLTMRPLAGQVATAFDQTRNGGDGDDRSRTFILRNI